MRRYKVIKIVYARSMKSALKDEKLIEATRVELDEEVGDTDFPIANIIGFSKKKHDRNGRK